MIINKEEIYILLNEYYLRNIREISVEYPLYGIHLFDLNMENFKITNIPSSQSFESFRRKYAKNEFMRRDLPGYYDLLDAFLSSNVIDFENRDEIEESFELVREAIKDKTVYIKPIFIGIDTNMAYYRVVSRRLGNKFRYVISQIVVDEIDARIHTKYSGKMLHYFEDLPYHYVFQEFANGSVKESRKAKNAMNEINYLFTELDAFRTGKSTGTKDKEVRDREIAMQYRGFGEEVNGEVVILTADKDMAFHAQAQGISSIYYKLPHKIDVNNVDPVNIPNLFYDLITAFGIIKIGNTLLLGEWRGKEVEDYINERLKIYNVDETVAREISICRGVEDEL